MPSPRLWVLSTSPLLILAGDHLGFRHLHPHHKAAWNSSDTSLCGPVSFLRMCPLERDCWVLRSYRPSFPTGCVRALSTAARCIFPPAVPTFPICPRPSPTNSWHNLSTDFCSPNRTNLITHLLSWIHISLITGDSAHPFLGLLLPGFPPLFKEMVTVTMKSSSFPGPNSALT